MTTSPLVVGPPAGPHEPRGSVLADLLAASRHAAAHRVPEIVATHAAALGAHSAVIYLVDLDQIILAPWGGGGAGGDGPAPLPVDSTLAGRAYQHEEVVVQAPHGQESRTTVFAPLCQGADRLGVLALTMEPDAGPPGEGVGADDSGAPPSWIEPLAALVADLVVAKALCSDTLVNVRRSATLDLAAEIQWGLLPPLTFGSAAVTIAASLEPAYEVAGDSVDYAVEEHLARFAVFDGMGHGLRSAQLAALTVAAYRNNRRSGCTLVETACSIDASVELGFAGESFATGILAELCVDTGRLEWVNAGHPEPLLLRHGRHVKTLSCESGLPFGLGLQGGRDYPLGHDQLEPGDRVLLFTDGVVEARAPSGDQFGVERLVDLLSRTMADNLTAAESMRRVSRALLEHQQARLADDATMLLMEWSPQRAGAGPEDS
ncbi:MAG: PP2C family protein-serine/threonine phosphatase [Ornithinibacter sp.]